jgi:hypothetical protein
LEIRNSDLSSRSSTSRSAIRLPMKRFHGEIVLTRGDQVKRLHGFTRSFKR